MPDVNSSTPPNQESNPFKARPQHHKQNFTDQPFQNTSFGFKT